MRKKRRFVRFMGILAFTLFLVLLGNTYVNASTFGDNLIINGGAETWVKDGVDYTGPAPFVNDPLTVGDDRYIDREMSFWNDPVPPGLVTCEAWDGAVTNLPPRSSFPLETFGNNVFIGGYNIPTTGGYFINQTIDVSGAGSAIDVGALYEMSGWFGGFTGQSDTCQMEIIFKGVDDVILENDEIGVYQLSDWGGNTNLVFRTNSDIVPVGTRSIEAKLKFPPGYGFHNGMADNLSLVLKPLYVFVEETGESTDVSEDGTTDSYTIRLRQEPNQPTVLVTATPVDNNIDIGNGSGGAITLTFTPADWNTAQTVTVSAVDDDVIEADHVSQVDHTVSSGDSAYDGKFVPSVMVNIADNDVPGITIVESEGSTDVIEGGASDSYTIRLDTEPNQTTVEITVMPDEDLNLGAGDGSAITLTFSPGDWDTPQTVTVSAVDDTIPEGLHLGRITHVAASSDILYDGMAGPTVWCNITDDEGEDLTVARWTFDTAYVSGDVIEDRVGGFDADLQHSPPLSGGDFNAQPPYFQGDLSDPNYLIEVLPLGEDWYKLPQQKITLEAWVAPLSTTAWYEGFFSCLKDIGADENGFWLGVRETSFGVGLTTKDNNTLGFTFTEAGVVDPGVWHHVAATYDGSILKLYVDGLLAASSERTGDINYADPGDASQKLGFSLGAIKSYNNDDSVRLWNPFDGRINELRMYNYGLNADDIMSHYQEIGNSDGLGASYVFIAETGASTNVSEEGPTLDTYTVVLNKDPNSTGAGVVEITVEPTEQLDVGAGAGNTVTLTFDDTNWDVPQTVTVTAVDDEEFEDEHMAIITHSISNTNDPMYAEMTVRNVYVLVADNDCGVWGFSPMDFNQDCRVDMADYAEFAKAWTACTDPGNRDGCEDLSQ